MQSDNIHGELTAGATLQGSLNNNTARMSGFLHEGFGGTSDYNELENKPSINGVTLEGNVSGLDIGIYPPINYAFTPQCTFKRWIDGKMIWMRVFELDYPQGEGNHLIDSDLLNYIDTIISITGCADYRSSGQNYQYQIPYVDGYHTAMFMYDYTGLYFRVVNDNFSGYKVYCFLEYTMI